MNDIIKLAESEFALVPAGDEVVLTITSAKAMPKAKPTKIEVVFTHSNGGTIKQTYDLVKKVKKDDKNPLGLVLFSILARTVSNDASLEEFSISKDLPTFVGVGVVCKIEHTEPNEKGNVFANIKRIIKKAEDNELEETVDEEDDL